MMQNQIINKQENICLQQQETISKFQFVNGQLRMNKGILVRKEIRDKRKIQIHSFSTKTENKVTNLEDSNNKYVLSSTNFNEEMKNRKLNLNKPRMYSQDNHFCREIIIEESRVNIYALKSLIKFNKDELQNIAIVDCEFYVNDKYTLQNTSPISNNLCLQKLNFTFYIRSLLLPQIISINIQLQKIKTENLVQKKTIKNIDIDQQQMNKLIKDYECNEKSTFIIFEKEIKPFLEEKYSQIKTQKALFQQIIGEQQEQKQISKFINKIIIQDIQDHVQAFNYFIKNSFHTNILVIKEDCLENPISSKMMSNVILKNKNKIKTVIFKEMGTIRQELFSNIIDQLLSVKQLESIAFFSSQPEQSQNYIINDLCLLKKFKFVILNKTSFDLTELQRGSSKQQKITNNDFIQTPQNHYSFYLIDFRNSYSIYEFTPYEFCIKEILNYQEKQDEVKFNEELQNFNIGNILNKQKQYSYDLIQEIKKYQNKQLLYHNGICEKILIKYSNNQQKKMNPYQNNFDQQEVEIDIKQLIKYKNIYSINKSLQLITKLTDSSLSSHLRNQCVQMKFNDQFQIGVNDQYDLDITFLKEIGLLNTSITGFLENGLFLSSNYPKPKKLKSKPPMRIIQQQLKKFQQVSQFIETNLLIVMNEATKCFDFEFNNNSFLISEIYDENEYTYINKLIEVEILKQSEVLYQSEEFLTILQNFIQTIKNKNLEFQFKFNQTDIQQIWPKYNELLGKENTELKKIEFIDQPKQQDKSNKNVTFNFHSNIQLKELSLNQFQNINLDTFQGYCNVEVLVLNNCLSKSLNLSIFKKLKKIKIILQNDGNLEEFIQSLIGQKVEQYNNIKVSIKPQFNQSIEISKEIANNLLCLKSKVVFKLLDLSNQSKSNFYEVMLSKIPEKLNYELLSQFYGIKFINSITPQISENKSEDHQQVQNQNKIDSQQEKYQDKVEQFCKEIKKIYNNMKDHNFKILKSLPYGDFEYYQEAFPKCCLSLLQKNYLFEDIKLIDVLNNHMNYSCLFKISLFQSKIQPRKVQIKFFQNFSFNKPQIYNYQELQSIEKIDFSNNIINDIKQIMFIDFLIQQSPQLKSIKFNKVKMQTIEPFSFNEIKASLIKLKSALSDYKFVSMIFKAINPLNLESILLVFEKIENPHEYSNYIYKIFENNKNSLKKIKIQCFSKSDCESILKCEKVQKLITYCTPEEYINGLIDSTFKDVIVLLNTRLISQSILTQILNKSIENLQRISIQSYQDDTVLTYYLNIQDKNTQQFHNQIIHISQGFNIILEPKQSFIRFNELVKQQQDLFQLKINVADIYLFQQNLQRLHLTKQTDYQFLNLVFQISNNLEELSINHCELQNSQLSNIDFSKLPKSIKKLDFSFNGLSSLQYLDGVYKNIKEYKIKYLNIYCTEIPESEVFIWYPHIDQIVYRKESFKNYFDQCQKQYQDKMEQLKALETMCKCEDNDESTIQLFHDMLFGQKICINNKYYENLNPLIISPLQASTSFFDFKTKQMKYHDLQKQDGRFKLNQQMSSKYFLLCAGLINNYYEYILGYSKNYNNSNIYTQKNLFESKNKEDLTNNEHYFNDYLLLLKMQNQSKIKQIILPITLQVSEDILNNKKISTSIDELEMMEYLIRVTPSELILDGLSVQFIKSWYVINFLSPLTIKTSIQSYNSAQIYNSSIGNYLTSNLHRNNFFRKFLNQPPQNYKYDKTVFYLSQDLNSQIEQKKHFFLLILFLLYLFVCIFGVVFFSMRDDVQCGEGISQYSYYMYLGYGLITLFTELLLFSKCLNYISHLVPTLEINLSPGCLSSLVNSFKLYIIESPYINSQLIGYSKSFLQSQLARFDNFTNVAFLYSTYQCKNYVIFIISLFFMSIPLLYSVKQFLETIFRPTKKYQIQTHSIDLYYKICDFIEFKAVSEILDLVSPSNVIVLKGKMFNSKIISSIIRILGESIPLVILQIYNLAQQEMTSSLVISLSLSILSFLSLLLHFLTITPSTLNQEDFNKLNKRKEQEKSIQRYEQKLQSYEDEMFTLKFFENLKIMRYNYINLKNKEKLQFQKEDKLREILIQFQNNDQYFSLLFDNPTLSLNSISN